MPRPTMPPLSTQSTVVVRGCLQDYQVNKFRKLAVDAQFAVSFLVNIAVFHAVIVDCGVL